VLSHRMTLVLPVRAPDCRHGEPPCEITECRVLKPEEAS
jgi:hypothetical protein